MNKLKDFVDRIWERDYTLWKDSPGEISNRLGWLDFDCKNEEESNFINTEVEKIIRDGFKTAVLIGMGGSSLAPYMFSKTFEKKEGFLDLIVIDTTDPDYLGQVRDEIDLKTTLFIASSKSGATIEVFSIYKYFFKLVSDLIGKEAAGKSFVAITDPDSGLEKIGIENKFRLILLNDPNIGGRYSALSFFGLFPAALLGIDIKELLERSKIEKENSKGKVFRSHLDFLDQANFRRKYKDEIDINFAVSLGSYLGQESLTGKDKLTFLLSEEIKTFGQWLEQLIAESTGKEGKGILPVACEIPGTVDVYGNDRIFVKIALVKDNSFDKLIMDLKKVGHSVIEIDLKDIYEIGGQIFLWEMAVSTMCYVLGVNPFDQPDVEKSKIMAKNILDSEKVIELEEAIDNNYDSVESEISDENIFGELIEIIDSKKEGDYFAIQAFIKESKATTEILIKISTRIRQITKCPVTIGYGPKYLHSTGQLHKGDNGNGIFIQLTSIKIKDIIIPGFDGNSKSGLNHNNEDNNLDNEKVENKIMSFGSLINAQAKGDEMALLEGNRKVISINLGKNIDKALSDLLYNIN